MDLKSSFQSAWRAKFTNQPPPSLSCFSKGTKHKPRMENLRQAYEQCKCSINSLQKQLAQEQFVENFLKSAITDLIENNEKTKEKSELNSETEISNEKDQEMIENSDKNGIGFIEVVEDENNSYVRVTSFKSTSSSRWKRVKNSVKKKKWDKTKFKHNYETINLPLTKEKITDTDESFEKCKSTDEDDSDQSMVVLRTATMQSDDACSDDCQHETREHRLLTKTCSDPISRISSIPIYSSVSGENDSQRTSHRSPATSRMTRETKFNVQENNFNPARPTPPPRKSKSNSSTPPSPNSDQSEVTSESIYDNVTRIYVKPCTNIPYSGQVSPCTKSGRGPSDIDVDVNSGGGGTLKLNDWREFSSSCTDDNVIVNNVLSADPDSLPVGSPTSKTPPQSPADGESGEISVNMRKFRLKSGNSESDCVVGTSFRKIDRMNSTDTNRNPKLLDRQISTESCEQTENNEVVKNRKTLPVVPTALKETKKQKRRSIPHYENWSFHSALTRPGISIIEQDFVDTGSDDDNISVASTKSRDSALSDDVQICDAKKPALKDTPYKTSVQGLRITEEDVYYSQKYNSDSSHDFSPRLNYRSIQSDDDLSQQSVDSVLQNHGSHDGEKEGRIVDMEKKEEQKSEEDSSSNDSFDEMDGSKEEICEDEQEKAKKLRMRYLVLKAILESEFAYMNSLDELRKIKRLLQNVAFGTHTLISLEDVTTIFYKVEDIYKHHQGFVQDLQNKLQNWSDEQQIGKTFKVLVLYFPMYVEYMNHYQIAKETIHRCSQENSEFQEIVKETLLGLEKASLEEILFKPVQRIQKNTLVLHDLLKYTPRDHLDYEELEKALTLSEYNLKDFGNQLNYSSKLEDFHHLMKSGFIVEMVHNTRKLRYLFLFNDVIICTKHKPSGKNRGTFECKWFIPLSQSKIVSDTEKQEKAYNCKENIDELKRKIVGLKSDLSHEMKIQDGSHKDKPWSLTGKKTARQIQKLKKRISEQEAALVLASPHLPLRLNSDEDRPYVLLLSTDFERDEWREALQTQANKFQGHKASMNIHDVQEILENCKQLPEVNSIGTVLMKKDEEMLSGSLNVTIHQLNGLEMPCDTYCSLELDSYGHFFMKARTTVCRDSVHPSWDMDFELDLDGSQTLRILCYRVGSTLGSDVLLGRSALELSREWLKDSFCEKTISMNEISLIVSIRHSSTSKTMKRTLSKHATGIFGVKLENTTRREAKTVPSIVTNCVQEIEERGLDEVGIYRVSGVTSDIQRLKKLFDKNPRAAVNNLTESDINAVTGVLKLYFRELPEPLFTDAHYRSFIDAISLSDAEAKEKCLLQLLHSLPDANYYTILYLLKHLVKVSRHAAENKMTLKNLSTIFGPTLLHPAVRDSMLSVAELMEKGAQEVFTQSGIVFYLLNLVDSGKDIHRSAVS